MIVTCSTLASAREIAIVAYPGVQSLDVTGPLEVFAGAQRLIERTGRASAATRCASSAATASRCAAPAASASLPHGDLAAQAPARSTR